MGRKWCRDSRQSLSARRRRHRHKSKISEAQVADDELVCPQPGCGTQITIKQIEGATAGSDLWEKFLQFKLNLWRPPTADGMIVECPTPNCERFEVGAGLEVAKCPRCRKAFCPKCREDE